jgi:hypothetical protein
MYMQEGRLSRSGLLCGDTHVPPSLCRLRVGYVRKWITTQRAYAVKQTGAAQTWHPAGAQKAQGD